MQVFHCLANVSSQLRSSAVAIGNFDGCHLGHQSIVRAMVDYARANKVSAVVLTFYPHPVEVLNPAKPLQRLTTASEKLSLLEALGVDLVLVEKFDTTLAHLSPEVFFKDYLMKGLKAKEVHVGFNFFFGRDRTGNTEVLRGLCKKNGIELQVAAPLEQGGQKVSSSAIRTFIKEGQVAKAAEFLGRPYSMTGQVVFGDKRGAELGFPTANLRVPAEKTLPKDGVYVTRALWQKQSFVSVTNIGSRPTFHAHFSGGEVIEVHLVDFGLKIYDEFVEIEFLEWIRAEQKFSSAEALKEQIAKDVQVALNSTKLKERLSP